MCSHKDTEYVPYPFVWFPTKIEGKWYWLCHPPFDRKLVDIDFDGHEFQFYYKVKPKETEEKER